MNDSEEQDKRNETELRAWMLWKKICSVEGCKDVDPAARKLLRSKVVRTFRRKISAVCAHLEYRYGKEMLGKDDCDQFVQAFDTGLLAPHLGDEKAKSPIPYKDRLWQQVANSKDPPLKVIRGKLTGGRSYTNDIVEHFIRTNYDLVYVTAENGKKVLVPRYTSLDALHDAVGDKAEIAVDDDEANPVGEGFEPTAGLFDENKEESGKGDAPSPATLDDLCTPDDECEGIATGTKDELPPERSTRPLTDLSLAELDVREFLQPLLHKKLLDSPIGRDYRLAAILLAHLAGLPLTNERILDFCQIKKSMAGRLRQEKALPALQAIIEQDEGIRDFFLGAERHCAFKTLLQELTAIVEVENGSAGFLSYVEGNM